MRPLEVLCDFKKERNGLILKHTCILRALNISEQSGQNKSYSLYIALGIFHT